MYRSSSNTQVLNSESVLCRCERRCPIDACAIDSECFTPPLTYTNTTEIPILGLGCSVEEGVGAGIEGECLCKRCASSECSVGEFCFDSVDFLNSHCSGAEVIDPNKPACTCTCFPQGVDETSTTCTYDGFCIEYDRWHCRQDPPVPNAPIAISRIPLIRDAEQCTCPSGYIISSGGGV